MVCSLQSNRLCGSCSWQCGDGPDFDDLIAYKSKRSAGTNPRNGLDLRGLFIVAAGRSSLVHHSGSRPGDFGRRVATNCLVRFDLFVLLGLSNFTGGGTASIPLATVRPIVWLHGLSIFVSGTTFENRHIASIHTGFPN